MDDTQKNDGTGEEDVDEDWRSPSQLKSPVVRGPEPIMGLVPSSWRSLSQLKSQAVRGTEPIYGFGAQQLAITTFWAKKIRAKQLQLWCMGNYW